MQRLSKRQQQLDLESISLDDDGELQDRVFCLHCHSVNSSDAEFCTSCQHPLVEPAADLRDRLERISAHNGHRVFDERSNDLVQTSKDTSGRASERRKSPGDTRTGIMVGIMVVILVLGIAIPFATLLAGISLETLFSILIITALGLFLLGILKIARF